MDRLEHIKSGKYSLIDSPEGLHQITADVKWMIAHIEELRDALDVGLRIYEKCPTIRHAQRADFSFMAKRALAMGKGFSPFDPKAQDQ